MGGSGSAPMAGERPGRDEARDANRGYEDDAGDADRASMKLAAASEPTSVGRRVVVAAARVDRRAAQRRGPTKIRRKKLLPPSKNKCSFVLFTFNV